MEGKGDADGADKQESHSTLLLHFPIFCLFVIIFLLGRSDDERQERSHFWN